MEFDALLTIWELAIGLVGITGIVAVFLSTGEMSYFDKLRFLMIVITGCSVAFLAFVPLWLARFVEADAQLWRVAALTILIIAFLGNGLIGYFSRRFWKEVPRMIRPRSLEAIGIALCTTVVLLLLGVNLIGWPVAAGATYHELVLFFGLIQMAMVFAHLVMVRTPPAMD